MNLLNCCKCGYAANVVDAHRREPFDDVPGDETSCGEGAREERLQECAERLIEIAREGRTELRRLQEIAALGEDDDPGTADP